MGAQSFGTRMNHPSSRPVVDAKKVYFGKYFRVLRQTLWFADEKMGVDDWPLIVNALKEGMHHFSEFISDWTKFGFSAWLVNRSIFETIRHSHALNEIKRTQIPYDLISMEFLTRFRAHAGLITVAYDQPYRIHCCNFWPSANSWFFFFQAGWRKEKEEKIKPAHIS